MIGRMRRGKGLSKEKKVKVPFLLEKLFAVTTEGKNLCYTVWFLIQYYVMGALMLKKIRYLQYAHDTALVTCK